MTATELPDARRFEALAAAVAGRPLLVAWGAGPTWTDGRRIEIDPAHANRARDAVIVQAALLGAGALEPDGVRRLRGRPARVAPYLARAVPEALALLADRLPPLPAAADGPAPWWGTIRADRLLRAGAVTPPTTPVDVVGAPPADQDGDDDGDEAPTRQSRRRGLGRRIADQSARRRSRGGRARPERSSLGEASAPGAVRARQISAPTRLVASDAGPILVADPPGRAGAVARYPEWDARRQAYRPDWCTVHEPHPESLGLDRRPHPLGASATARRRLARVHLDLQRVRRQRQGEELDLDALVDHRVAVAAGTPSDGRVYRDVVRRRRDLGVLLLVDGSGSTGRTATDGLTTTERQLEATAALVDAFESLGDRVACMTFRSHGRRRVELTSIKGFARRFGPTERAQLAAVRPEGFTRLGAAVRHATALLRDRSGSRHQLLVVLSDGFPFDAGYEGDHARADVDHALAEARRAGVGALCLSIGAATAAEELRAVFGSATYASGPHLQDLGADLSALVRAALAGADRSRRVPRAVSG